MIDELQRGDFPTRSSCVDLVSSLPVVAVDVAVLEIVQASIQHHVMPADPLGDALHLALASYHRCDFLVTWNCKHLANANSLATFGESMRFWDCTTLLSSRLSSFLGATNE